MNTQALLQPKVIKQLKTIHCLNMLFSNAPYYSLPSSTHSSQSLDSFRKYLNIRFNLHQPLAQPSSWDTLTLCFYLLTYLLLSDVGWAPGGVSGP